MKATGLASAILPEMENKVLPLGPLSQDLQAAKARDVTRHRYKAENLFISNQKIIQWYIKNIGWLFMKF